MGIIAGPAECVQNSKHILTAIKDSGYRRDVPPRTHKLSGTFPIYYNILFHHSPKCEKNNVEEQEKTARSRQSPGGYINSPKRSRETTSSMDNYLSNVA